MQRYTASHAGENLVSPRDEILYPIIRDSVYIAQHLRTIPTIIGGKNVCTLQISACGEYFAFCDDFGPFNLSCIVSFIEELDKSLSASCVAVICAELGRRQLTNAVFLCGAYLMLRLDYSPEMVQKTFADLNSSTLVPFRDATFSISDFDLDLLDCWRGFDRAIRLGWFSFSNPSEPVFWGQYDIDEYKHYQDPLNGDLHEVVPGKFIAFKGPTDLGELHYDDLSETYRAFSPLYFLDIFQELGVSTVIRLNEPCYDGMLFWNHGIAHYDLEFEDCTVPPKHIVDLFFTICDRASGAIAVHCKAGLGRTGTLIAMYMMRHYGFAAREAIGWLRIVRPGCVIGRQQHYLCAVEDGTYSLQELEELDSEWSSPQLHSPGTGYKAPVVANLNDTSTTDDDDDGDTKSSGTDTDSTLRSSSPSASEAFAITAGGLRFHSKPHHSTSTSNSPNADDGRSTRSPTSESSTADPSPPELGSAPSSRRSSVTESLADQVATGSRRRSSAMIEAAAAAAAAAAYEASLVAAAAAATP